MAILTRQAELQSLFKGTPFKVFPKAYWQPLPKKKIVRLTSGVK